MASIKRLAFVVLMSVLSMESKASDWPTIPGNLMQIDTGLTTAVWGVNSAGAVYRLRRNISAWRQIPGARLKHVSAGEAGIWGVDKSNKVFYRVGVNDSNPDGTSWKEIPGKLLKQIDSGPNGIVFGVAGDNKIYCRTGIVSDKPFGTGWTQVDYGELKYISCGVPGCWGVASRYTTWYRAGVTRENCGGTTWYQVPGSLKQIEVGAAGDVYGINSTGQVLRRTGISTSSRTGNGWQMMQQNGSHITTGLNGQYLLVSNGQIHYSPSVTNDTRSHTTPMFLHNTTTKPRNTTSYSTPMFRDTTTKIPRNTTSHSTPMFRDTTTKIPRNTTSHSTPMFRDTTKKETGNATSYSTPTSFHTTTKKARNTGLTGELEKEISDLENKNISDEVREREAQKIIGKLSNFTNLDNMNEKERENGLSPLSISETVRLLNRIVDLNVTAGSLNILGPANNILDDRNEKSWKNFTNNTIAGELITTLEVYAFQYGDYLKINSNASRSFTYQNLDLRVKYIRKAGNMSMEERLFKFPNATFNLSPDALSKTSGSKVVVIWYKTIHRFINNRFHGNTAFDEVNNEIITASVRPQPPEHFQEPVRLTWNSTESNHLEKCVYWKPERSENKWKTEGCRRKKDTTNERRLICECNHLTAFAVIDISGNMVDGHERRVLELISTVGCSLSLVGIILTILTYALLWKKLHRSAKSNIPSQVLMHLCVAIGMTDIFAILAGPARNNETYCTVVSILLYFFILVVFGWMLCEGIVIYLQLVNVFTGLGLGGKHLKCFYLIGWGIPVAIVAVLVGASDRNDFITERACWCGAGSAIFWTFISTIGLILMINVIIFILALRNALSSSHIAATSTSESNTGTTKATVDEILRKVKIGLRGFAVLLPLLGLTWVFGLLVFNRDTIVFKYLFAICNSLQGVVIFVFHVLVNRKVHDAISTERKARMKARNYTNASNNECGTLSTSGGSPCKSSIPGTPSRPNKTSTKLYRIMNLKKSISKKGRNSGNLSEGDKEEYIEIANM